jgi:hypothetical protein
MRSKAMALPAGALDEELLSVFSVSCWSGWCLSSQRQLRDEQSCHDRQKNSRAHDVIAVE